MKTNCNELVHGFEIFIDDCLGKHVWSVDEEQRVVCESVGILEESGDDDDKEAEISCSEPTIR